MTDIKPRIVDGVGWCDAGCPQCRLMDSGGLVYSGCMALDGKRYLGHICPVHAKRTEKLLERCKDVLGKITGSACDAGLNHYVISCLIHDGRALLAEMEE